MTTKQPAGPPMTLGNMRRSAVSVWTVAALDQGEEPKRTGSDEGDRGMRSDRRRKLPIKSSVEKIQ